MIMIDWYLLVLSRYAEFSGRSRRSEYWWFTLFNFVIIFIWSILTQIILATTGMASDSPFGLFVNAIPIVYSLAVFLPTIGVTVRRLHDTGRSGWWMLLNLIPFGVFIILYFCTIDSNENENTYGLNPKTGVVSLPPARTQKLFESAKKKRVASNVPELMTSEISPPYERPPEV